MKDCICLINMVVVIGIYLLYTAELSILQILGLVIFVIFNTVSASTLIDIIYRDAYGRKRGS